MDPKFPLKRKAKEFLHSSVQNAARAFGGSLAADVGYLTVSKLVATAIGLVMTASAARVLGPQEFGRVALLMGYPLLVWSFASVKSLSVTTRYMARFRSTGQLQELSGISKLGYGIDALSGLVAALVIAASGGFVNESLFNISTLAWLSVVFGLSLPFYSLLSTSYAVLTSCARIRWLAVMQVFDRFITFLLVVAALVMGFEEAGVVLATAAAHVTVGLTAACVATLCLTREGAPPWWRSSLGPIKNLKGELKSFFGWTYLTACFSGVVGQGPALLLGHWQGTAAAGFYRLAMSIFSVSSYAEASLWAIVYPRLSIRWGAGERDEIRDTLWRWTRRFGLPLAIMLLGAVALSPFLIPAVLGGAYKAMVTGVQFLLVGAAVSGLFFYLNPFYYASGRFDLWGKAYGLYAAVVIGLTPIAIDRVGFSGVAALVGLGFVAFNLFMAGVLARTHFHTALTDRESINEEGSGRT